MKIQTEEWRNQDGRFHQIRLSLFNDKSLHINTFIAHEETLEMRLSPEAAKALYKILKEFNEPIDFPIPC